MKIENAQHIEQYYKRGMITLDTVIYGYRERPGFVDHYKVRPPPKKLALGTVRELLEAMEKARSMRRVSQTRR